MEEKLVRFTRGLVDPGIIVPLSEVSNYTTDPNKDYYHSYYYYPKDALEYFKNTLNENGNNTLKGYSGTVKSDHLVFDFDDEDLDKAKQDAITTIIRLIDDYSINEDSISAFFSGGKGFHILVKLAEEYPLDKLESMCKSIAGDLETFDDSIYSTQRIFRIPNTKHNVSGLYKIELDLISLRDLSITKIKELAKKPSDHQYLHTPSILPTSFINSIRVEKPRNIPNSDLELTNDLASLDLTKKPKDMPYCKFAILNGFFKEGNRSNCLMALASHHKSMGYPREATYNLLLGSIDLQERRYPSTSPMTREEVFNVVKEVYGPNWKGGTYSCKDHDFLRDVCPVASDKCRRFKDDTGIQTVEQLNDGYLNFTRSLKTSVVKTGINFLDRNAKFIKGSSNYVVARAGCGKTNLVLNILRNTNLNSLNTLFFSADMASSIVYQRMASSVTGLTQDEIEMIFNEGDRNKINDIKLEVKKHYGNTTFNTKSSISIDIVRDSIKSVQETTGKPIDLVIIDYNERVMNQYSDPMNSVRHTALNLVDLSRDLNICFVTIAQVSRTKGSERTELISAGAAKESGAVEESANLVITMWRPLFGTEYDNFIGICIAKNRMGKSGITNALYFDGEKSIIRDMSKEEEFQLHQALEEVKEREALDQQKDDF